MFETGEKRAKINSLSEFNWVGFGLVVGGGSGNAIRLNAHVVLVHVNVEETLFTPVSSPRVATDPELLTFLSLAISDDSDGMVYLGNANVFRINPAAVVRLFEGFSDFHNTRDRSILKLGLHLVSTDNVIVLTNIVTGVRSNSPAVLNTTLVKSRNGTNAVTTNVDCATEACNFILSDVVHAGRVNKTFFHGELEDRSRISTVARATCLTVDHHLGIKANWRLCGQFVQDVESISNARSGRLGPARAAVLRNVLILCPRKVVPAILISPVEVLR